MTTTMAFPTLLETFFTDRLLRQQRASPHTIASYRDTFSLLLRFAQQQLGKAPSVVTLDDLDAPVISAFLDYLDSIGICIFCLCPAEGRVPGRQATLRQARVSDGVVLAA
jgi:hypothetical protein